MDQSNEIRKQIEQAAGIVDGKLDGEYVCFTVKQMYGKVPGYTIRRNPLNRYQITVHTGFSSRAVCFRTSLKNGYLELKIEGIVDALKGQVARRKDEKEQENNRKINRAVAVQLREKYKLQRTYVSEYAGSRNSFCAASAVEGLVDLQISFGSVTPEVAEKILAFAKSLEA